MTRWLRGIAITDFEQRQRQLSRLRDELQAGHRRATEPGFKPITNPSTNKKRTPGR